jgi:hypothetical protein
MVPEIKSLDSAEIERPAMPDDPSDCSISFEATIGLSDSPDGELFAFTVATPLALARETRFRWGRGLLVMPSFSWEILDVALARLLARCHRDSWSEIAQELAKQLNWEFDGYRANP